MATTIAARKAKGRRLVKELCNALLMVSNRLGLKLTGEDIRPVPSSVIGEDVWLSTQARYYFPYSFECKNQEKVNIWQWWKQTTSNCGKHDPVLVIKRNNEKPLVIMDLDSFISLSCDAASRVGKSHQSYHSKPEALPDTPC